MSEALYSNAQPDLQTPAHTEPESTLGQPGAVPVGSLYTEGQSEEKGDSQTALQPESEGDIAVDGETSEEPSQPVNDYEKMYKSLQADYGRRNESEKSLRTQFDQLMGKNDGSGINDLYQLANNLNQNPRFSQWLQDEKNRQVGLPPSDELDDDTKAGLDQLNNIFDQRLQQFEKQLYETKVKPLEQKNQQEHMNRLFEQMDTSDHKEYWKEYLPDMEGLLQKGFLSQERQNNPSFQDLDDVLTRAIKDRGDFEKIQAQAYQKRLIAKKNNNSGPIKNTLNVRSSNKAGSLREAANMAKRSLGLR